MRAAATQLWEENFSRLPNGDPRCYLGQLSLVDGEGNVALLLRVFTIRPYTAHEKAEYTRLVAAQLDRPVQSVLVRLIEIPTVSSELSNKAQKGASNPALRNDENRAEEIPTMRQLQTNYEQTVETTLGELRLPAPAIFVDYEVTTYATATPQINVVYLSEREIDEDGRLLLIDEVRRRFENAEARVSFQRIQTTPAPLSFRRRSKSKRSTLKYLIVSGNTYSGTEFFKPRSPPAAREMNEKEWPSNVRTRSRLTCLKSGTLPRSGLVSSPMIFRSVRRA